MKLKLWSISFFIFVFFFMMGLLLAQHKPLWVDELFEQQSVVQRASWNDILIGHLIDINRFPLFSLLQKGFLHLFSFHLPVVWQAQGMIIDQRSQVLIRILPDVYMSLALTAMVVFFAANSGVMAGAMTFLICLSMSMVWLYWAEARYYSLWFMFTTFQSLLFLFNASKPKIKMPILPFFWVHLGLCLCSPMSMLQCLLCLGLCWFNGEKRGKFYLIAGLLPLLTGSYYLLIQAHQDLLLSSSWQDILSRDFPVEELVFLGIYLVLWCLAKGGMIQFVRYLGRTYLPFCMSMMALAAMVFIYLASKKSTSGPPVVERHFIFLVPVAIIMTAVIFSDLWKNFHDKPWMRVGLLILFVTGLAGEMLSTFLIVYTNGFY